MLQVTDEHHFGLDGAKSRGNVSADKTSVVFFDVHRLAYPHESSSKSIEN